MASLCVEGKLDDTEKLSELVSDVELFCYKSGWTFTQVSREIVGILYDPNAKDQYGEHYLESYPIKTFIEGVNIQILPGSVSLPIVFDKRTGEMLVYNEFSAPPPKNQKEAKKSFKPETICINKSAFSEKTIEVLNNLFDELAEKYISNL